MKRSALLLVALAMGMSLGCGPSVVQLSHDEFDRLPRDSRQEIFDAENDLVIARNRQDEAADRKAATERALDELSERWKRTEKRLNASGQGGRSSQARKVYDANKTYLKAQLDVTSAAIDTAKLEVDLSRARLLLVRQRQAARIGRATLGSLKPLEEKVASSDAKVKASNRDQTAPRTEAQKQLDAWKGAEDEYARATNDYDTGVWE